MLGRLTKLNVLFGLNGPLLFRLKAVLEEIGTGTGTGAGTGPGTGSTTDSTSIITQLQYIQDVLNHLSTKVE